MLASGLCLTHLHPSLVEAGQPVRELRSNQRGVFVGWDVRSGRFRMAVVEFKGGQLSMLRSELETVQSLDG